MQNGVTNKTRMKRSLERAVEWDIDPSAIDDSLKKPFPIGNAITDKFGRKARALLAKQATGNVNPDTRENRDDMKNGRTVLQEVWER